MNIVVTGANRGLGLGFVQHYLSNDCHVWACFRKSSGPLESLSHRKLERLCWDVAQNGPPALKNFPDRIDLLINNAGIYGPGKDGQALDSITRENMLDVFAVNCIGPLMVVQHLKQNLIAAKGVIANVSSKMGSSGDNTSGGAYAYRAAKAGLVIVSKSMANDLVNQGIRVITLHPGWVKTDMTDQTGLIDIDTSVAGMAKVIRHIDDYKSGAFIAYDGRPVPY